MSQYSNEFGSIIKQLRKISANTCAESEQMPYYEKEVCGTLPDVEGQTSQYTLIRVYTRDIDTGQIVLSHYEDTLGNIISGTVVEACCDSAVCGSPYSCAANIVGFYMNESLVIDITGSSTTGFIQFDVAGTLNPPTPMAGPWALENSLEILEAFKTGGTTITLFIGNNVDLDLYCSFSFVTLADLNEDIKEDGDNPNWNPFPALVADLKCTGTLTYNMIYDSTGNGVTINSTTGNLTIPAGIYTEVGGNSWVYVEVRCDGVLVAVAGLQLLNEALGGLRLEWDDIANTPFATHTDLNSFINGNGGAANYTSVEVVGNVQTFYGGTAVILGDSFMNNNVNIVGIRDDAFQVVAQGNGGQSTCAILETVALPALITQGDGCQYGNPALTSLNLQAMTAQGSACQSSNDTLLSISLPNLTTQTSSNQTNNTLLTAINLPLLTTQTTNNQSYNASLLSISMPSLTTQVSKNQRSNAVLPTISLPSLTTQTSSNQSNNTLLTAITLPLLTTQVGAKNAGNQSSNPALLSLLLPSLTTQGAENQISNAALTTISLPLLTTQTSGNQNTNPLLTSLSMPALTTQTGGNQQSNASLVTLTLPSLITQENSNQSDNAAMTTISLPALTAQLDNNQGGNASLTTFTANLLTSQTNDNLIGNSLLTTITTPALTSIGTGNYVGCTYNILTIDVDASLFGAADILLAQAGGATII